MQIENASYVFRSFVCVFDLNFSIFTKIPFLKDSFQVGNLSKPFSF